MEFGQRRTEPPALFQNQPPTGIYPLKSNRLIKKLFSRQFDAKESTLESDGDNNDFSETDVAIPYDELGIKSCPYIRPSGQKLEPRNESSCFKTRSSRPKSRRFLSRLQDGTFIYSPDRHSVTDNGSSTIICDDDEIVLDMRSPRDIAAAATADLAHLREWTNYIQCYAEGRFNLITPPDPPPRNPCFTYLPAAHPKNETERLATVQLCNTEWSDWAMERAGNLVDDAMKRFEAPWAAISVFDRDLEIIKAECGYHRRFIRREESIAAHVLLTNEVMTVLDARADWRFSGNPLVIGNPRIRFFAGAPLLSADGEVIGVFSIFGPHPRKAFTAKQRRELCDFASLVMTDLTFLMERKVEESRRNTPLLKRLDLINYGSAERSLTGQKFNNTNMESGLIPPALRYNTAPVCHKSQPRLYLGGEEHEGTAYRSEHTPPTSDESDGECSPAQADGGRKNFKHLSIRAGSCQDIYNNGNTSDSPPFPQIFPRAFSGSDLTSVDNNQHCVTPEPFYDYSAQLAAFRVDDVIKHTSSQAASAFFHHNSHEGTEYSSNSQNNQAVTPMVAPVQGKNYDGFVYSESKPVSQQSLYLPSTPDTLHTEAISSSEALYSPLTTINDEISTSNNYRGSFTSISTDVTSESQVILKESRPSVEIDCMDTRAEAQFAATFAAQSLGFDCLYAVEIVPRAPFLSDTELELEGAVSFNFLASYGLQEHAGAQLNRSLHLSLLRKDGFKFWDNSECEPGEAATGFMMKIKSYGASQATRSHGVVFAAFRTCPKNGRLNRIKKSDITKLENAALVLQNILFKRTERHPSRANTAPTTSPTPESHWANEAMENAPKYSLDSGGQRIVLPEISAIF